MKGGRAMRPGPKLSPLGVAFRRLFGFPVLAVALTPAAARRIRAELDR